MQIRKITTGIDYKNGMHYVVEQEVLSGSHKIHAIVEDTNGYFIHIENQAKEVVCWKYLNKNLPIVVEFNINY